MLDTLVRYLRSSVVPFRLSSYPSPELEPTVGHPMPRRGILVESRVIVVSGRRVLACFPADEHIELVALGNELGGHAIEATLEELPEEIRELPTSSIPPLGQLFGLPLVVDERIRDSAVVVFRAFGPSDYIEINYDDFARQERPRIASFALAGELTASNETAELVR